MPVSDWLQRDFVTLCSARLLPKATGVIHTHYEVHNQKTHKPVFGTFESEHTGRKTVPFTDKKNKMTGLSAAFNPF